MRGFLSVLAVVSRGGRGRADERCLGTREPADQPASGGDSNGADRSRSEAERAQRGRPRDEASGRSDAGSDDTGAQRGTAREREGAFGNAVITAEVRYFLVTKH